MFGNTLSNLSLRIGISADGNLKSKYSRQDITISLLDERRTFIANLMTQKSSDLMADSGKLMASNANNKMGIDLDRII